MGLPPTEHYAVGRALARHETLPGLLERVRNSRARLAAIQGVLPPGLAAAVEAGPLDDQGWVLLARHAPAAAKLRQCLPQIESRLAAAGFAPAAVRVKVLPKGSSSGG